LNDYELIHKFIIYLKTPRLIYRTITIMK